MVLFVTIAVGSADGSLSGMLIQNKESIACPQVSSPGPRAPSLRAIDCPLSADPAPASCISNYADAPPFEERHQSATSAGGKRPPRLLDTYKPRPALSPLSIHPSPAYVSATFMPPLSDAFVAAAINKLMFENGPAFLTVVQPGLFLPRGMGKHGEASAC